MNKCECENSAESIISEYFYQHFKKNPDHQFKIELINLIEQKKGMEIWDAFIKKLIRMQLEDYTPMYKPSYDAAAEAYQKVKHLKNPDNLLMLICLKYLGRNFSNTMKSIIYEYILFKKH
ncbi:MAG TPA: hypothetical protein PKX15_08995 [Bacteroidales bacterium]|nr:hypothetical protein [Bacteroidales bacterium]